MTTDVPMSTLAEMLELSPLVEKSLSQAARSVYHRDYVRTKNKSYRKYDPTEHKKHKNGLHQEHKND